MSRSQMIRSVLQALALTVCSHIIFHHLITNAWEDAQSYEAFTNLTKIFEANEARRMQSSHNGTETLNTTIHTQHSDGFTAHPKDAHHSFYWNELPKQLAYAIVLLPMKYYWQIWLEKMLPGRARPSATILEKEFRMDESAEAREEVLIQRLIAQGKIKRSSLCWWNTFLKWMIDLTLGQMWISGILIPLLDSIRSWSSMKTMYDQIKWGLLYHPWISLFGLYPLASLLSLAIVPASKRIVFVEGVELLSNAFIGTVASVLLLWIGKSPLTQEIMKNATESMLSETQGTRLSDEL